MTAALPVTLAPLYPAQHAALYHPARVVVIEASTKAGKTAGALVWQTGQCVTVPQEHWWVAPVYPQARIAYRRALAMLPRPIVRSAVETRLEVTLVNGARWTFKSGEKPDNLYGEDVASAVIDEASRLRAEAWHAVRSTLTATRGPLRIIGNVRGRANWHYQLARKAEAGEPGFHFVRLTAWDAVEGGVLDAAEVEQARRDLPDSVFRELYLCEPSDDGGNPFGISSIASCVGALSSEPVAAWGLDLARVADWTVAVGLDASGRVCRLERWRDGWASTVQRVKSLMDAAPAPGYVDATGVGDGVSEWIRDAGVSCLEPFVFTSTSKQRIMEGLALSIQRGEVSYPDGVIRDELELFEYHAGRTGVRYSAPEGCHDDAVCALALANARLRVPAKPDVLIAWL